VGLPWLSSAKRMLTRIECFKYFSAQRRTHVSSCLSSVLRRKDSTQWQKHLSTSELYIFKLQHHSKNQSQSGHAHKGPAFTFSTKSSLIHSLSHIGIEKESHKTLPITCEVQKEHHSRWVSTKLPPSNIYLGSRGDRGMKTSLKTESHNQIQTLNFQEAEWHCVSSAIVTEHGFRLPATTVSHTF